MNPSQINDYYQQKTMILRQQRSIQIEGQNLTLKTPLPKPKETMNQKTIIAVIGLSNAGKTTISKYLENNYSVSPFTPIDHLKRFLENVNGLETGELNTQEGKSKYPDGTEDYTFGETLLDLYHFWKEHDPLFASRMLMNSLDRFFAKDGVVCSVESIRNIDEVSAIASAKDLYNTNLYVFNVMGLDEIQKTSDGDFEEIESRMLDLADEVFPVFNTYDGRVLSYIDDIMGYLCSDEGLKAEPEEENIHDSSKTVALLRRLDDKPQMEQLYKPELKENSQVQKDLKRLGENFSDFGFEPV